MKSKFNLVALFSVVVGAYSCSSDAPVVEYLSVCDATEMISDTDIGSTIGFELLAKETLLITDPNLSISIYGSDISRADVPATLITKQCFTISKLPFFLILNIPKNPSDKITMLSAAENARYYAGLEWDSDGNGKRCAGDITQDFDRSDANLPINLDGTEKQIIYLTNLTESSPCN